MASRSLDEAPTGEAEEYVLERTAADQAGLGPQSAAVHRNRGCLAVAGVEEDAVGQHLDALRETLELVERRRGIDRKAKFEHLAGGVLVDEAARRAEGDDLRLVHDDQAITKLLGLIHVVGRE